MTAAASPTRPAAFSKPGAFAVIAGGFALFLALLWLIGAGADFGGERGRGEAHAAANGLNGYSGLVRLVEAQGYSTNRSRSRETLTTDALLVLAPPRNTDAEDFAEILVKRRYLGPTLVIMPKWYALPSGQDLPAEVQGKFKRGWVVLSGAGAARWPARLPAPYTFAHLEHPKAALADATEVLTGAPDARPAASPQEPAPPARWSGLGHAGVLPASPLLHAQSDSALAHDPLITDTSGKVMAFSVVPQIDGAPDEDAYPVVFLADPDLANNMGLADPARAAAAIALVDELTYGGEIEDVAFDMTLNGFGASENLLTLAFRPPFLAATLSLLAAMVIVGWRAFMRFGPVAAEAGPDIAFGKRQLIANGAGLILRARRFRLLGAPFAALAARRVADRLGLARPDPAAIDSALARRLPAEEPFTHRAARLEAARKPADLLAAAQSLDDLASKLTQGPK